jgi:arylsulfatase A-like enzyme
MATPAWGRTTAAWALSLVLIACGTSPPAQPDAPAPAAVNASSPTNAPATTATPQPGAIPASTAATAEPKTPAKLNVIVITIDAMRYDMPWNGYERDIAPTLTALEKRSVSYTRGYALSSYTAMSMGGFLAGLYPGELKRSGYYFSNHHEDNLFFPELLQKAGVRTLSAHAHFYFETKAGFQQGFDDYRIVPGISRDNLTDKAVTSPGHTKLAIEMLSDEKNTAGQFFAWFHFMDPHDLYIKHEGFTKWGTGQRDRYDGEMAWTDHHLAKLLAFIDAQPWGERTALIISADHGEAFGEHKQTRHGFELWENLVCVPMFFVVPGVKAKRIDTPRSHIDLAPTILDLMGVPLHAGFQGKSLKAELSGQPPELRDVIVDLPRTSDNFRRRALVHDRHKIIAFGDDFRYQLYDVVDDVGERRDLRKTDKELYKKMKQRYLERVKTIKDRCPKMRNKLKGRRPSKPC